MDNFSIIKRLYEKENRSLSYIARWMRMSERNLEHWIHRNYKQLVRQSEDSKKKVQRKQRLDLIKMSIKNFMNCNKGKWVVIRQMVEYANINYFADQTHLKVNYNEIYSWLKNQINFGWRIASQRPSRWFRIPLKMLAKYFKEFILKLKEACFVIVSIFESSFSSASLPLYSWMSKGWNAERVIRPSFKRYNVIAAQWNKESYFVIKSDSTNEAFFYKVCLGTW